jgi:ribonuclease R
MLPFELSNGICSLNPNVDRLVLSVVMDLDPMGNVFHSEIKQGVIRSHGRLNYDEVNDFFAGRMFRNFLRKSRIPLLFFMRQALL